EHSAEAPDLLLPRRSLERKSVQRGLRAPQVNRQRFIGRIADPCALTWLQPPQIPRCVLRDAKRDAALRCAVRVPDCRLALRMQSRRRLRRPRIEKGLIDV